MNIKLYSKPDKQLAGKIQVLLNRGIEAKDIFHYLNTTDKDINSPKLFGESLLNQAFRLLGQAIKMEEKILVIVDSDCDGYVSSALFINYLHKLFPYYTENYVFWYIHEGKQHGLNDCVKIAENYSLIIVPDGGTNDIYEHNYLYQNGVNTIILDHHEAEVDISKSKATIINNHTSVYPNKELAGVGVTWQFCRYIDSIMQTNYANELVDLVALGLTSDMMSLLSIETRHLITKGFESNNIKNPFIYNMWKKNSYSLGDKITSWGAAFYIAPLVNAIVRSGSTQDKQIVFESMLDFKAYEEILSTKRGHKPGEMEPRIAAALRTCVNVKKHQTEAEQKGLEFLEKQIIDKDMLNSHKVLTFLIEPGDISPNIAGLVANRLMGKYQRPVCVLTHSGDSYSGSARGCDAVGITNFKDICEDTSVTLFVAGHQGAFGLGIAEENIEKFYDRTDLSLIDMQTEPVYMCDYLFHGNSIDESIILDIADMDEFWGKDVKESLIAIEGLKITKDMVTLMSPDKKPTLKIQITPTCSIIKFGSSQEEYEKFTNNGYIEINLVGKCNKNEWMGNVSAQIMLEDFEIIDSNKYYF